MSRGERTDNGEARGTLRAVAGVLLAAVLAAGGVLWVRSLEWPIEVVRIDGETRFSDRERLRRIITAHVRHGFFGTDLAALQDDLTDMPWVRRVSLRRIWPGRLNVDIREHAAAARWNGDGLVSDRGVVFRPRQTDHPELAGTDLPALSGPAGQAEEMLAALARFELRLAAVGMEVSAVEQDARRSWTVTLSDDMELRLGRDGIEHRLARVVAAWSAVIAGQRSRIDAVDVRYPNGFAVAWRDTSNDSPEGGA